VLKCLIVTLEMMAFLTLFLCGSCYPVPTPFSKQAKNSFKQTKEMTFDRRLANITGPLVRGLYLPSS